jgi:hypothetical protein
MYHNPNFPMPKSNINSDKFSVSIDKSTPECLIIELPGTNICINVVMHDDGVAADLYNQETGDYVVGTWALYNEFEED